MNDIVPIYVLIAYLRSLCSDAFLLSRLFDVVVAGRQKIGADIVGW